MDIISALILTGCVLLITLWAAALAGIAFVCLNICLSLRRTTSPPLRIPNTNVIISVGESLPRRPPPEVRLNIRTFEEGSLTAGAEDGCAICFAGFEKGALSTVLQACDHKFHSDCVSVWLAINKSCPLCRAPAQLPSQPLNRCS